MPENSVKIILEAEDKTSAALNSLKGNAEGLFSSLKEHWLEFTAAGASIYGVIKGIQSFVDEAGKAEQIQSRMAFQIQAVGINFMDVKQAIDAYANSIQETTRFSSEAAQQGIGQMMMYTVDLGKAMQGAKLAMDMATQTGMDFQMAMRYVGMAMNGDIEVLSRMNPAFRNLTSSLGENATQAEKAEYGLKKLKELFGGGSEKDLTTYEGKVEHFGNTWKEFAKTVGQQVLPVLDKMVEDLTKLAKVPLIAFGGSDKEAQQLQNELAHWENQLKNEEPASERYMDILGEIAAAKKRIVEISNQQAVAEKKVADASAQAVDTKNLNDFIAGWEKWTKQSRDTYSLTDELNRAFEDLGITSTRNLATAADSAVANMERIKKAWKDGKASVEDYKNALISATDALKKLAGPDMIDMYKQMGDANVRYEEDAKKIRDAGGDDFRKQIEARTQVYLDEMKKMQQPTVPELEANLTEAKRNAQSKLNEEPLSLKLNMVDFIQKITDAFHQAKGEIESTPIKINVDTSALSSAGAGGGAGAGGAPNLQDYGEIMGGGGQQVDYMVNFLGHASPTKPLSETIQDLLRQFGGLQGAMTALNSMIDFQDLSRQLSGLNKQLQQVKDVYQGYYNISHAMPHVEMTVTGPYASRWLDPAVGQQLEQMKADIMSQMGIVQLKMIMDMLQSYGGSFQTGGNVPRTGLYMLHKGEEVRSTTQVSNDNRVNHFHLYGPDPKTMADEIGKVLDYGRSGRLSDSIKRLR